VLGWQLVSCSPARNAAGPQPESEQVISEGLKTLYMKAAASPRQSPQQQKVLLEMADKASNGKELLLVMRASDGVFPSEVEAGSLDLEKQLRSTVTAKMLQRATLSQLIEYSTAYPVDTGSGRKVVERLFELGDKNPDPGIWYRIRKAAYQLKEGDLEKQALARADSLAGR
jgi:hypothetical protein